MSHFVPFIRPLKVSSLTKGAEWRTPRVCVCLQIEAMIGVTNAVTHDMCFQREGERKSNTLLRVWIFSCLSATFVFINPVIGVCVVQVRERNDEPRSPPRNFDRSIDTHPTGPRATDWLVCVIGLVSLLCSPPIPVRCHWQQQTARRRTVASTFQRPPAVGQGMTAFYPCTILTGRA